MLQAEGAAGAGSRRGSGTVTRPSSVMGCPARFQLGILAQRERDKKTLPSRALALLRGCGEHSAGQVRPCTEHPPGARAAAGTGGQGWQRQTHSTWGELSNGTSTLERELRAHGSTEPSAANWAWSLRDFSFSEVITEEAKKRGPGGWEVLAGLSHPLPQPESDYGSSPGKRSRQLLLLSRGSERDWGAPKAADGRMSRRLVEPHPQVGGGRAPPGASSGGR